ncbi:MAG: helix-turn-helix domain-containing protein [Solobacterium sp.]|nr:helix-turn-helix domain-containing protein [Solobacterium sp.]
MKEKKRLLQMLYYLSESDKPLRSADLAKLCGISVRTVKGDAQELADLAAASGAELRSKKGTGFWLEATDTEAFRVVKEQLGYQFSNYTYTSEYENKVNVFTRRLLVSEEYVTAQMLADELWLARSTIKPFIGEVRKLAEKFKLNLISKPSYGLKLEGLEVSKRFCMLELYLNHDTRTSSMIGNREFRDFLDMDKETAKTVRKTVLDVLRGSGFSIRDQMTHRLIRYMPLACFRSRSGYHAMMPESVRELLLPLPLLTVAKKLLSEMKTVFPDMPQDEDEALAVEYLLLVFLDPIAYEGFPQDFALLLKRIIPIVRTGVGGMISTWDLPEDFRRTYEQRLRKSFLPVYAQLLFPEIGYSFVGKEVENNENSSSPFCIALAYTFLNTVSEAYGCRISRFAVLYLGAAVFLPVQKTEYPARQINLLIGNRMGSAGAQALKHTLVSAFGKGTFGKIDFIELYEGRTVDLSQYDCMIANYDEMYFHYDLPYIKVSALPSSKELYRIHEELIMRKYLILDALQALDLHMITPEAPPFKNQDAFAQAAAGILASDPDKVSGLTEKIRQTRSIAIWNKMLFLIIPAQEGEDNRMGMWEYDRGYMWENRVFSRVIFLQVSARRSAVVLKVIDEITRLVYLEENMQELKHSAGNDGLLKLIRRGY